MKQLCSVLLLLVLTRCALSLPPYEIRMSLTGRIDERVVMWTSDSNAAGSVVYWQQSLPGITYQDASSVATYTYPGYTVPYFHTAILSNLVKNTTYVYQVQTNGEWSQNYTFTTENTPEEFSGMKILMMGDMSTSSAAQQVVNRISTLKNQSAFDFVLYAGDLSYADSGSPVTWKTWQDMIAGLTADLPWMFSVGNHENEVSAGVGFTPFNTRFTMPYASSNATDNMYYSFNYENVHVIALNSEASSFDTSSPMYIWLQNDLASVNRTQTPWIIATWHHPWYCTNVAHYRDAETMRVALEPLLYQYGVDIILNGHVHAYERTTTIYNNNPISNGIVYLNVGSAGQNLHTTWNPTTSWSMYRISTHGVGIMTIYNSTTIYWEFVQDDGAVLDTAWIYKSTTTPSVSPTPSVSRTPSASPSVTPSVSSTPSVTPSVGSSPSNSPSSTPSSSINSSPSSSTSPSITPSTSSTTGGSSDNSKTEERGWIVFGVVLLLAGIGFAAIIITVCMRQRRASKPQETVDLPQLH